VTPILSEEPTFSLTCAGENTGGIGEEVKSTAATRLMGGFGKAIDLGQPGEPRAQPKKNKGAASSDGVHLQDLAWGQWDTGYRGVAVALDVVEDLVVGQVEGFAKGLVDAHVGLVGIIRSTRFNTNR
jgi:hypothetical protein